jgi:DNA-binding MarR family transcriptional regulator|tara:strand:+ start:924 stop:1415 length:492 start_codon:yes stop_codon:yes gene_type:complete
VAKDKKLKSGQRRRRPAYQALMSLVRVSALLRKAGDKFFQLHGVTQSQFNVLLLLKYEFPRGCNQNELCKRLLVHPADVTGLVRRMLKNDLVHKERPPGDERSWRITISETGLRMLSGIEEEYYKSVDSLMNLNGEEPPRRLMSLLGQVEQNIMTEMGHRLAQ